MKIDPYKNKEKYLKWKENVKAGIPGISKENSDLILKYLRDMEKGMNISLGSVKGPRGFSRLNTIKEKILLISRKFKDLYGLDNITSIKEEQLMEFFCNIKNGVIKRYDGKAYETTRYFAKEFKAFWNWWIKVNRKNGNDLKDITEGLDTSERNSEWVYLTEDHIKKLAELAKYEYKVLIWFLYDSGIRAPTELMNIKVSDLSADFEELNIREEISKTFGRRIKLRICSQLIKEYVKNKNLSGESYLFTATPRVVNKYFKRLGKRVLGDEKSSAGKKYSSLTMHDFRHCSCCFWLKRYKSESALKYRLGLKRSDRIHPYSALLGMKDTIAQEDLFVDTTKIERDLDKAEKENKLLREDNELMRIQIAQIRELTAKIYAQINGELQVNG